MPINADECGEAAEVIATLPAREASQPVMQGLVHKVDFERLLSERSQSRSTHFALHHVSGAPASRQWLPKGTGAARLSTDLDRLPPSPVDKGLPTLWLGCLAPKRHARRAVTRNLIKRQMRGAVGRHLSALAPGLWLIRLRAPFALQQFPSARSEALAAAARGELDALLLQVCRPARGWAVPVPGQPAVR